MLEFLASANQGSLETSAAKPVVIVAHASAPLDAMNVHHLPNKAARAIWLSLSWREVVLGLDMYIVERRVLGTVGIYNQ